MFFKNEPKTISTFVAGLITNGAGLKTKAKNTNQLGPGLKKLTKLTKETFPKVVSRFSTFFAKVYVRKVFQNVSRESLFL